ncbi:plastocyanin/azurin family copper-binding protein [Streptomyces sp. DSM 44915]|uniref:Plastocyanin/azurin family copper-binding protein n=1 Tax=Streptomyces chisholmiae TaxID=3075540 RepID=A0ABU2JXI7_9ACTN|nr:plastocyanin/azurin family copper-binding protein [Streptomyces sp. DSM 44915]MDT0269712.1 plastocyanin/azurin family copper-binding protein [Streptomyces sp. DSM 44915]
MNHDSGAGRRPRRPRLPGLPAFAGRRPLAALLTAALTAVGLATLPTARAQQPAAATAADEPAPTEQVLTWTADNDLDSYETQPVEAVAGPATLVFENSEATGNTTGMAHTLTFDVSNSEYNNDVRVNILANPNDANGGRHEVEVELTPGTYRFFCALPGHLAMQGTLVVSEDDDGGGGEEDTTPPVVTPEITGEQDADGGYLGGATVELTATDDGSGVAGIEYAVGATRYQPYTEPIVLDQPGRHRVTYRATDVAGNVSISEYLLLDVVEAPGGGEDGTPPEVTAEVTGEQDAAGDYLAMATVELTATDADSAVAGVEYALGDGAFTDYTAPFMVHEPGEHTVTYRATDTAGNVSPTDSTTFTVVAGETPGHQH